MQRMKTCASEAEAQALLREQHGPSGMSWGELVQAFLADRLPRVRPTTQRGYRQWGAAIQAPFGDLPIETLSWDGWETWLADQMQRVSPRTVGHWHAMIRMVGRWAEARHLPLHPAWHAIRPPVVPKTIRPILAPEQVPRFLTESAKTPLHAVFLLGIFGGLRHGEILGLRWCDVDWDRHQLRIVQSLTGMGTAKRIDALKTASSYRTLTLGALAWEGLLDRARHDFPLESRPQGSDLVFRTKSGRPYDPRNVTRTYKRVLQAAGLNSSLTLHDLRHTHASLLLAQGIHPKVVSERLGHTNIEVTLNTYSHVLQPMQSQAAEALDHLGTVSDSPTPHEKE